MKRCILPLILGLILNSQAFANEVCSRIALINYQEVVVDTSSSKKGEGLRFYLEKDEVAKALLDEYQQKTKPSIWNASFSTLGSLMILGGLGLSGNSNKDSLFNQTNLLIGGALVVGISFLTSKTIQNKNEEILQNAVDHYNKRNTPRIYFSPFSPKGDVGVGVGFQQDF